MLTVQLRIPTFPAVQLHPHYCGHFYSEIAKHHEPFFTDNKCNFCGTCATKRKSKVIHLGTVHELVLKYIEDLKSDNEQGMNNYLNTTI